VSIHSINWQAEGHEHRPDEQGNRVDLDGNGLVVPVDLCRCGAEREADSVWTGGRLSASDRAWLWVLRLLGLLTGAAAWETGQRSIPAAVAVVVCAGAAVHGLERARNAYLGGRR
jgi:hypothetical protein